MRIEIKKGIGIEIENGILGLKKRSRLRKRLGLRS
jgi:hypothetical protein